MADEERGPHGLVTMISNGDEKKKQKLKKRKQSESSKSGDKSKKQKKNKSNKRDVSKAGGSVTAMEGVVEHDVIVSGEEEKIETDGECEVSHKDGSNDIVLDQPADKEDEIKGDKAKRDSKRKEKKKRWLEEATNAKNRGICYLSRIPPRMDHVKLRQILSQYGEIQRIYLAPEGPTAQVQRKRAGGFRGQKFLEGWVEFSDKRVALRVAKMLNNEQIGGKKRSPFYYDIWNIKYLSKFKWDDLTEEIAYKNAIREQKLALELSAAKRERDFYLSKVDQSRALSHIEERLKKKQKIQQDAGTKSDAPISQQAMQRVSRQFPQNKPVANNGKEHKRPVSKDVLAGVFG